jgi:hypothetical protein
MESWQVRLQIEAMACVVRVEGMKAENQARIQNGEAIAYVAGHFNEEAGELSRLAREIGMG